MLSHALVAVRQETKLSHCLLLLDLPKDSAVEKQGIITGNLKNFLS
jgi:hypothetical protein